MGNSMVVLEIIEASKGRYRLHLDSGDDIVLYKGEVRKWNLKEGSELSEDMYDSIVEEILRPRCRKRALHLLEKQERTAHQLLQKLREGGYSEALAKDAIAYCEGYGYINDQSYAERYVRTYQSTKSDLQIRNALYQKGIKGELVEQALQEREYEESDMIERLLKKRGYNPQQADRKEQQKTYQYLMRRGFSSSDIRQAMHL